MLCRLGCGCERKTTVIASPAVAAREIVLERELSESLFALHGLTSSPCGANEIDRRDGRTWEAWAVGKALKSSFASQHEFYACERAFVGDVCRRGSDKRGSERMLDKPNTLG